jgi:hypothetical protein
LLEAHPHAGKTEHRPVSTAHFPPPNTVGWEEDNFSFSILIEVNGHEGLFRSRMVKIFETFECVELAMMDSQYEDQRMGATAGVRNWVS